MDFSFSCSAATPPARQELDRWHATARASLEMAELLTCKASRLAAAQAATKACCPHHGTSKLHSCAICVASLQQTGKMTFARAGCCRVTVLTSVREAASTSLTDLVPQRHETPTPESCSSHLLLRLPLH